MRCDTDGLSYSGSADSQFTRYCRKFIKIDSPLSIGRFGEPIPDSVEACLGLIRMNSTSAVQSRLSRLLGFHAAHEGLPSVARISDYRTVQDLRVADNYDTFDGCYLNACAIAHTPASFAP
jgi:hypothetical protein